MGRAYRFSANSDYPILLSAPHEPFLAKPAHLIYYFHTSIILKKSACLIYYVLSPSWAAGTSWGPAGGDSGGLLITVPVLPTPEVVLLKTTKRPSAGNDLTFRRRIQIIRL